MRIIRLLTGLTIPAAIIAWLAYTFWYAYQPKPTVLQGQIEAQQYNISSKIAGRIDSVLVRKGDQVKKGDLIFTILSPEIEAKLAQAQAGKDAAQALSQEVQIGARKQQIEAARDKWQQAKAAAALMEKTYSRIDSLYKEGVVPEQKRDEVYTKLQSAQYTANAAYQMYQLAREGAREETKKAAQDKVRMAEGAVAEVEVFAAETRVESYHDGEVTQILLRSGEIAPQGFPVVTIMDLNDAWLVFHVREELLPKFPKGKELTVEIPALEKDDVKFRITHIAAMGDFATWRATSSDDGFDMRSFEIEARPVTPVENLRAGMSVLIK